MAFVIWSRRTVSHQRVRFVEARTVRTMVIVAVIAMILAALALGMAIGAAMGNTHAAEEKAQTERRSYEIDELGKISATLTHIEPRVVELVSQVNELQDFEAQLKASRRAAERPSGLISTLFRRCPRTTTNPRSIAPRAARPCHPGSATHSAPRKPVPRPNA